MTLIFPLMLYQFQSTLPMKGATCPEEYAEDAVEISIHAPYEGSDLLGKYGTTLTFISIHAPYEGSDFLSPKKQLILINFNPRSL